MMCRHFGGILEFLRVNVLLIVKLCSVYTFTNTVVSGGYTLVFILLK